MKSTNPWVWALVAALTLFLAGCGGGSSNTGTGDMSDPEPTPVEQAKTAYDKIKAAENTVKALRSAMAKMLAEVKIGEGSKLPEGTGTSAIQAAAYAFAGDSEAVKAAAKALVDAKTALEAEKMKADAAKTEAEEAKKALDALPADTPGLEAQKDAATAAIMRIEALIKDIEKLLKGPGSIGKLVQDKDAGSPASKAKALADRIAEYLSYADRNTTNVVRNRPATDDELTAIPLKHIPEDGSDAGRSKAVLMHNAEDFSKTFKEIVGEGNLVKQPFGSNDANVDVLPLAGMPLSALTNASGTALAALPDLATGKAETQHYKGIPGTVHCSGTCYLDGTTMRGDLYFRVTGNPFDRFQMKEGDLHYSAYTNFVTYGYWLFETSGSHNLKVVAYSTSQYGGNVTDVATATLPATATYKGKALGLSVLKTYTGPDHTGTKSGQFTADVTLNARFGADPLVGGTVKNFVGKAADPNWSVELVGTKSAFSGSAALSVNGVAKGSTGTVEHSQDGTWVSMPYNTDNDTRPRGFGGGFHVHFKNGDAAGAFATRMVTE